MSKSPNRLRDPGLSTQHDAHDLAGVAVAVDLSELTSEELAMRAQNGCTAAFANLFSHFQPRLVRFLERRLVGSSIDAEDMAQESLTKAWNSIASFDSRFRFATWLYTIAKRTTTDHLRRERLVRRSIEINELSGKQVSPDDRIQQRESAESIWAIARRVLTEGQYSALWLRYGEELSVKDVARTLEKTTVGVRVVLHRARAVLRPHLSEHVGRGADEQNHSVADITERVCKQEGDLP